MIRYAGVETTDHLHLLTCRATLRPALTTCPRSLVKILACPVVLKNGARGRRSEGGLKEICWRAGVLGIYVGLWFVFAFVS